MRLARSLALVVLTLALSVASAQASIITLNYDFSTIGFNAGAPVDPVTGSFSVTFDNATDLADVTSGISVTNLNIALGSAPAFTYESSLDRFIIGVLNEGADALLSGTDDIALVLDQVSTNPTFELFIYSTASIADDNFSTFEGELTTPVPSAVPEPATLCLLGLGLAGMGAQRWRQRKA